MCCWEFSKPWIVGLVVCGTKLARHNSWDVFGKGKVLAVVGKGEHDVEGEAGILISMKRP